MAEVVQRGVEPGIEEARFKENVGDLLLKRVSGRVLVNVGNPVGLVLKVFFRITPLKDFADFLRRVQRRENGGVTLSVNGFHELDVVKDCRFVLCPDVPSERGHSVLGLNRI